MEAKENKKENEAVIEDEIKKRRIIELLSDNDASDGRRSIIIDDSVLKDALEDAIELQEAKRRAAYSEFSEKADDNGINDLTITSLAEVPPLRRHILIDGSSNLDIEDAIEIQEASRRADDSETLEEIDDTNDKRNLIVDNFIPRRRSVLNPLLVTAVGSGLIGLGSGFWGSNMWKELKERWVKEKKENENNESVSGDAPPGGGGSGFDATKDVPTAEVQPVASATRRLYYLDE